MLQTLDALGPEDVREAVAGIIAERDSLQDSLNREGLKTAEFMRRCSEAEAARDASQAAIDFLTSARKETGK